MAVYKTKKEQRSRRHMRLRKKVVGTAERPRASICRTLNHIYAQFIDDDAGKTLFAASTNEKSFRELDKMKGMVQAEKLAGIIAGKAIAAGIKKIVFDRGGFKYHGRIKVFAETLRKSGLEF